MRNWTLYGTEGPAAMPSNVADPFLLRYFQANTLIDYLNPASP